MSLFRKTNIENETIDDFTDNEVWIMKDGEFVKLEVPDDNEGEKYAANDQT